MVGKVLRLELEVEPDSEPIRGSLAPVHGQRRTFHGWMELAATLQALTETPAAQSHPEARSSSGSDEATSPRSG